MKPIKIRMTIRLKNHLENSIYSGNRYLVTMGYSYDTILGPIGDGLQNRLFAELDSQFANPILYQTKTNVRK